MPKVQQKKTKTAKKDKKKALLKKILAQLLKQKAGKKTKEEKTVLADIPPKSHPAIPFKGGPYLYGQLMQSEQPKPEEKKTEIVIKQEPINLQPFEELKQKFLLLEDRDRNYNENLISNYNRGVKEGYQNFYNLFNQNKTQAALEGHAGLVTEQPNTEYVSFPAPNPSPLLQEAASIEKPPEISLDTFSSPFKMEKGKWVNIEPDSFNIYEVPDIEETPTPYKTMVEEDIKGMSDRLKSKIGITDITQEEFEKSKFFPKKTKLAPNQIFVINPVKGGRDVISLTNENVKNMFGKPDFDLFYTNDIDKLLENRFRQFQHSKKT